MSKVLAVLAAVVALLVPAGVANATPVNPVTIVLDAPSVPTVYPVADGFRDSVTISGSLNAPVSARVRATVSIAIGTRILKSWILSTTGPFSFDWNGRAGSTVVAGSAKVLVRVSQDDGSLTTAGMPLGVSAKKITRLTYTKTASFYGDIGYECLDGYGYSFDDPRYAAWERRVCPLNFGSTVSYSSRSSSGPLYVRLEIELPSAVLHSLGPVTPTVTGRFVQTGSGANSMWVCADGGNPCATTSVKTWSGSATVSAATRIPDPQSAGLADLGWWVKLAHGHDLSVPSLSYSITITYYGLR